jgi:hypothetical protein
MTKEQLWGIYCRKNPQFEGDGNVTMSARGLRKMFDVTWDTAIYDGEDEPCLKSESQVKPDFTNAPNSSVETLMKMFGMKS